MKRHFLYNPKTNVKRKNDFWGRWLGRETMAMEGCKEGWQPRIRRNLLSREVKLVHLVSRVTGPFLFSELLELCTTMCKTYSMLQLPESLGMAVHMKYLGLLSYRKSNWEAEGGSSIPNEPSIMVWKLVQELYFALESSQYNYMKTWQCGHWGTATLSSPAWGLRDTTFYQSAGSSLSAIPPHVPMEQSIPLSMLTKAGCVRLTAYAASPQNEGKAA